MTEKIPYTAPRYNGSAFNCPFCKAYANQIWFDLYTSSRRGFSGFEKLKEHGTKVCFCSRCGEFSIWHEWKMIYPEFSDIEPPNQDLNADIQRDYLEAVSIVQKSPRGAAALLRLAIQKLMIQLGEKGKDLNTDIGNLVEKGLPIKVQQSLDALRVIGNEAVHPGELDLRDDEATAEQLFKLINFIGEKMITEPKEIETIYAKIPESKKQQINERDKKQTKT